MGLLAALAAALLVGGCGSATTDRDTLGKSADAVHSTATEGALLADDAAAGRTIGTYRSVHAAALEETVSAEARTLEGAQAEAGLRADAARLANLADDVARLLVRLEAADAAEAGRLAEELRRAARRADELGGSP